LEPELSIVSEKYDTILNITPQTDYKSFNFPSAFQNEINQFIECCITGNKPISPVEDGVEIMKILCGIYESSEKNSEIRFS
jgi:predicted dehydrogenase